MFYKFYNPTPQNFKIRFNDTVIVIPAKEFVVVGKQVGEYIDYHYPVLETYMVSEDEYKEYRKSKEAPEKKEEEKVEKKVAAKKPSKSKKK